MQCGDVEASPSVAEEKHVAQRRGEWHSAIWGPGMRRLACDWGHARTLRRRTPRDPAEQGPQFLPTRLLIKTSSRPIIWAHN